MVVVLPTPSALMDIQGKSNDLGVQLYFDETSYKTMFSALSDVMRAKNNQLSHLRDVLLGQEKPGQRELFPIRFPWLNRSQEEAVNKVLGAETSIYRTRPSRNRENNHLGGSHLRDPSPGESSDRLRSKQYRRRLHLGETGR